MSEKEKQSPSQGGQGGNQSGQGGNQGNLGGGSGDNLKKGHGINEGRSDQFSEGQNKNALPTFHDAPPPPPKKESGQ